MPRPTARVLALLELLQAGGVRTAAELAARLEVDERTVRRYVEHLLELEVPIEAVRGRYGGFRIAAGSRLPPLMLTDDEAVAVALGLGGVARTGPSTAVRTAAETAGAKLVRVLPERLAAQVPAVQGVRSTVRVPPSGGAAADVIATASAAVEHGRPLRIRHRRGEEATERTVLPWGVVEHEGRWYLVGLDSRSDEVRTFRMDRIESVAIGDGRFTRPADADPARTVLESLAAAPRDYSVRVLVQAPEARVRRLLPPAVATLEPGPGEGWLRISLEAARLEWVAGVLVALDCAFRVEQPAALLREVRALAVRLHARITDAE